MSLREVAKIGKRGTVVIPAAFRHRMGIDEGSYVVIEESEQGLLIHGAMVMPIEIYSTERKAEFLLNNALDAEDYRRAREDVHKLGLDPDKIAHEPPRED